MWAEVEVNTDDQYQFLSVYIRPNYTQKHVITYTNSMEVIPWLSYFFSSRHARIIVMSIFHCYVNIKRI